MADAIAGSRTLLFTDPEAAAYFLNADGSAKTLGTIIKNLPGLRGDLDGPGQQRCQRPVHRPDCREHRQEDQDDQRWQPQLRDHAWPDRAQRPGRLPGQEARSGLHHLSQLLGLRHGRALVGRHDGGLGAGHAGELLPGRLQAHGDGHQWRQTHRHGRSPDQRSRAARPMPTGNKYMADTDFIPCPAARPPRCWTRPTCATGPT